MANRYQTQGTNYVLPVGQTLSRAADVRAMAVPFRIDVDGSVAVAEGRGNIVRQDMHALLMTYLGERLMMPFYGSNLYDIVWESQALNIINVYLTELSSLIEENFPGVTILTLEPTEGGSEDSELVIQFDYVYDEQHNSIPIDIALLTEVTQ